MKPRPVAVGHPHRDPFDRLLIVQAIAGGWTSVTADDAFVDYGVPVFRT